MLAPAPAPNTPNASPNPPPHSAPHSLTASPHLTATTPSMQHLTTPRVPQPPQLQLTPVPWNVALVLHRLRFRYVSSCDLSYEPGNLAT
ncbi:hypothetical protein NDU88_003170 [Pleurodeles waltl]|uniref:Uncharacterized protein n=1 Tax=Pleurodeles waltl TaxID=8319 RepID=A0AAV7LEH6_PLEWA|nr:hypothetical protein NDU88_003170 [Pleurodeles waltl]